MKSLFAALAFLASNILVQAADPATLQSKNYPLIQGWKDGQKIYHYTFYVKMFDQSVAQPPSITPTVPIYKMVLHEDDDIHNTTQQSLIDAIPGDDNYSDLWQVVKVVVPAGQAPIKSQDTLLSLQAAGTVKLVPTDIYVNCPVVGPNSTLGNPSDSGLISGFYRNQTVQWFNLGENPRGNATENIYHIGPNPNTTLSEVVVTLPPIYSAFWDVYFVQAANNVDVAATYRNRSSFGTQTPQWLHALANCPISLFEKDGANVTVSTLLANQSSSTSSSTGGSPSASTTAEGHASAASVSSTSSLGLLSIVFFGWFMSDF